VNLALGVKSDPVEYRFSYEWLFSLLAELRVPYVQLGSSMEFYHLDDDYFTDLRRAAERRGVRIRSCFTAHRELGGFFADDSRLAAVARRNFRRWIEIGALVGADYVGSNPGAVYRDRPETKEAGVEAYLAAFAEMQRHAFANGLSAITIEPMSSAAEPPSLPEEIDAFARRASDYHAAHPDETVPAFFCGDISHAYVDTSRTVRYDHWELFEREVPFMAEFHFKNTDAIYGSTFGFGAADRERGIVDLHELRRILERRKNDFPVDEVVGYLEIGGPKLGRDYSDHLLRPQIEESIAAIRDVFPEL